MIAVREQSSSSPSTNSSSPAARPILQRKCACGGTPGPTGECEECKRKRLSLQPKLAVNQPGDRHEREADRVAEAVVGEAAPHRPSISLLGDGGAVRCEEAAQASLSPATAGNFPFILGEILRSPGQPLDAFTRGVLEPRFGHNFAQIRVHNTSKAAESARAANALAYTVGNHVVFGQGQYQPATQSGRRLLAHELTHCLQQNSALSAATSNGLAASIQRAPVPGSGSPGMPGMPDGSTIVVPAPTPKPGHPAADACPQTNCECSPEENSALETAKSNAQKALSDAAGLLGSMKARKERRLFEQTFGRGAATAGNISNIKSILSGASKFLGGLSLGKNVHCDFQAETDGCKRGASAFYREGQIFVCTTGKISKSISPPELEPREEVVQSGDSSAPGMGLAPSPPGMGATPSAPESMGIALESSSKTKERQRKKRERAEAELAALMAHEAVHHIIRPGIIDVYRDERLFQFLGGGGNIARELAPIALKNPDSIVAFAFRILAADGSSELPGAEQLLKDKSLEEGEQAGTLSGELEIGPVIGHEKIKLAMALAQEAIEQSGDGVAEVLRFIGAQGGSQPTWGAESLIARDVVRLLQKYAKESHLTAPTPKAHMRLTEILTELDAVSADLKKETTIISRGDQKGAAPSTIKIKLPRGFEFQRLSRPEQVQFLLREILKPHPKVSGLALFVWEFARKHGGLSNLSSQSSRRRTRS